MRKTYVLDTNVLIQAPYALDCFEDNDLVLPLAVLEELDGLKKAEGERGANARAAIRALEWHRCRGDLLEGVPLESGGTLRVESNCVDVRLPDSLSDSVQDNRILRVCKGLHEQGGQIVLVTKDILLRLKAQMLGLAAEDFTTEQRRDEWATPAASNVMRPRRGSGISASGACRARSCTRPTSGQCHPPSLCPTSLSCCTPTSRTKRPSSAACAGKRLLRWSTSNAALRGQAALGGAVFLQEALMQPAETAPLVIVRGMAGTAKTFYSLAVGLEKLLCEGQKSTGAS